MRLFVAVNFNLKTLEQLEEWQYDLQEKGVRGYWRRRENLHITLKFLGEVEKNRVEAIKESLANIRGRVGKFDLKLSGLGVFPNLNRPRILWLGVKQESGLKLLQAEVEKEMGKIGFLPEKREYTPHITLASGGINGITSKILEYGKTFTLKERVEDFQLMHSLIENGIRKYKILKNYELES